MTDSLAPPAADASDAGHPLIDVTALRALLGRPDVCILDCRHDLARPESGLEQYRQSHVPGAVFVHLDRDLSGPKTGGNGRHPLPEPQALAARFRAWGVGNDTQVVAYDASEGSFAARAWWLLRWLGHERVSVLDGGWTAWVAAGFPTRTDEPVRPPGDFSVRPSRQRVVGLEDVLPIARQAAARGTPARAMLLDARAPDRYEGRNETIDPAAGHIPGAINRFWKNNLDAQGRFKTPVQLRAEYDAILAGRPAQQVIVQCGSGVTACHDLLALHLAGLPGAALFPGSWSQWVADPSRPIAVGPAP
jgi:thiosulfate/3-mercaptopyruvate sulfurtransferase